MCARFVPGFSGLAILCLTLGIGANAAVFSWMEGLLFRPYPMVANQERLVALTGTTPSDRTGLSWPDFTDLQRNCTLFDTFFVSKITGTTLSIGDRAQVGPASTRVRSSTRMPESGRLPADNGSGALSPIRTISINGKAAMDAA